MNLNEYAQQDGVGLAKLVRAGEISAAELAQVALAAIDAVNPRINAVVETFPERAATAAATDGPFGGVPFLRKDAVLHEEGGLTEMGSRLVAGLRAPHDSFLMKRFRNAGFVTLGRTTSPEMAFNVTTESLKDGPTRNPWDTERSVGGSSGGAAAAVASGMVPVAHANDGGGSIRIPAACCGVVGLKPTRGRVSIGPDHGAALSGMGIEHVVSRTVRDCAVALDAVQGAEPGDPFVIPPPSSRYRDEAGTSPGKLRIAFTARGWSDAPVDDEVRDAVLRTASELAALGHELVEDQPAIDAALFNHANAQIWCGFIAQGVEAIVGLTGRKADDTTLEATSLACYAYGASLRAVDLLNAEAVLNLVSRQVAQFFAGYHLLLTPTIAQLPAPLGTLDANQPGLDGQGWAAKIFRYAPFTALFNATGQPAISLPLRQSATGLPIGMQFVARFGDEALLLRLAGQLEQALPWAARRPLVWAGNFDAA